MCIIECFLIFRRHGSIILFCAHYFFSDISVFFWYLLEGFVSFFDFNYLFVLFWGIFDVLYINLLLQLMHIIIPGTPMCRIVNRVIFRNPEPALQRQRIHTWLIQQTLVIISRTRIYIIHLLLWFWLL